MKCKTALCVVGWLIMAVFGESPVVTGKCDVMSNCEQCVRKSCVWYKTSNNNGFCGERGVSIRLFDFKVRNPSGCSRVLKDRTETAPLPPQNSDEAMYKPVSFTENVDISKAAFSPTPTKERLTAKKPTPGERKTKDIRDVSRTETNYKLKDLLCQQYVIIGEKILRRGKTQNSTKQYERCMGRL